MATEDSIPQTSSATPEPPIDYQEVEDLFLRADATIDVLLSAHCGNHTPPAKSVARQLGEVLESTRKIYAEYEKLRRAVAADRRQQEEASLVAYLEREVGPLTEGEREFVALCRTVPVEDRPYVLAIAQQVLNQSTNVYPMKEALKRKRPKAK